MINKDRIRGSAEQAKGKVKEWVGKVTGTRRPKPKARPRS
jgi:uncharacterized protein YjbJ (UPF0337 family)